MYVVWWDSVNSLQIRNWMAGATNIKGSRKEIGVAVDRKLLKRHSNNIENLAMKLFNEVHLICRNEIVTVKNVYVYRFQNVFLRCPDT